MEHAIFVEQLGERWPKRMLPCQISVQYQHHGDGGQVTGGRSEHANVAERYSITDLTTEYVWQVRQTRLA